MLNATTIRRRQLAIENAVATQRLEGLEPDVQAIAELRRAAQGELEVADVLQNLRHRISRGEFDEKTG
ncbi:antitoxin VbhA family protein [Bordetella genomosp. 1]|uniref:Antitoxin n=1 Tax=Bordetella genomosp. 1 TaxID=1395607 RepID=A0ABX4EXR2_9BORD|nr:antitoxin VbhA family protein [Bordetella genomosp. 1]MDQ8031346.1 antitoxin VbhA family protein [Bordetella sp.]OZI63877.1 antitoxin [Bordetella genomosp. 1]